MRTVRTFVLRLLVDADEPKALRGAARSVMNAEEHAFSDGRSLLALLRRLCVAAEHTIESGSERPEPGQERKSEN